MPMQQFFSVGNGLDRAVWNSHMMGPWFFGIGALAFVLLMVWVIFIKGLALWRAARKGEKGWFVALLIINTLGILELIYLYVISAEKSKTTPEVK